MSVLNTCV